MGLLDDLLSNVAGQAAGGQVTGRGPQERSASGGMSQVMIALLPVVLAMLAQRRGDAPQTGRGPSIGPDLGGLGGLLGSLLGGAGGTGGLGDLLAHFQRAGLGAESQSWVSRGQNQPLSPDGIEKVFGRDALAEIARQAGSARRTHRAARPSSFPRWSIT